MSNIYSLQRSEHLTDMAQNFLLYKQQYYLNKDCDVSTKRKQKMLIYFQANEENWNDWKWQLKHQITNTNQLADLFDLSFDTKKEIDYVRKMYRWAVTPYYLAQIRKFDKTDPIYLQTIPQYAELKNTGIPDPMNELNNNPAGAITRRYPDRVTINLTNCCASFCRHCQRKRNIGETDIAINNKIFKESIYYLENHPEIRDVLLTGGDPLMLDNNTLDYILKRIRNIKTIEIIRIGTRVLVTLPQRINSTLITILKKYDPIYINTQFNHPNELSDEVEIACRKVINNGIPIGNQMVFLKGINNDYNIVALLNELLIRNKIRPYYIFHPKDVLGTKHFFISIEEGLHIYNKLRGNISGLAIPTYIYNAPGGLGKIPLNMQMLELRKNNKITLKSWEGKEIELFLQ